MDPPRAGGNTFQVRGFDGETDLQSTRTRLRRAGGAAALVADEHAAAPCGTSVDTFVYCCTPVHQGRSLYRDGRFDNCADLYDMVYECARHRVKGGAALITPKHAISTDATSSAPSTEGAEAHTTGAGAAERDGEPSPRGEDTRVRLPWAFRQHYLDRYAQTVQQRYHVKDSPP